MQTKITEKEMELGQLYEAWDENSATWVVGILINTYDCEEHPGCILSILRDDGVVVEIDSAHAMVYTAPNYNIKHFKRSLQRHLYELEEKMNLIMRGLHYVKKLNNSSVGTPAPKPPTAPGVSFSSAKAEVKPTKTIEVHLCDREMKGIQSINFVGWISDPFNALPKQLMLPYYKGLPLQSELTWDGYPVVERIENGVSTYSIQEGFPQQILEQRAKYIGTNAQTFRTIQQKLNDICDLGHCVPPEVVGVCIVNDAYEGWPDTVDKTLPSIKVDKKVWDYMGWICKDDPMYVVGTRLLTDRENEADKWVFITAYRGAHGIITFPMTDKFTLENIKNEEGFSRIVCDSDPAYLDGVMGEYENVFKGALESTLLEWFGRKVVTSTIDMIKLIPTQM